jgi:hypothetical protein
LLAEHPTHPPGNGPRRYRRGPSPSRPSGQARGGTYPNREAGQVTLP